MKPNKKLAPFPEDHFKHGQLREIVLAALGVSVLVAGIMISPNFPIVMASIINLIKEFTKKDIPSSKIKRVLKNLEKREILDLFIIGDEIHVRLKNWLTPSTVKYSLKVLLELKRKEKKWTGKWFLVMFDVPEVQKNKRIYLRNFLKYIGFYQYQKSVYIYPYECEQEITLLKKVIESAKYLSYIVAEKIENEQSAKLHFKL